MRTAEFVIFLGFSFGKKKGLLGEYMGTGVGCASRTDIRVAWPRYAKSGYISDFCCLAPRGGIADYGGICRCKYAV